MAQVKDKRGNGIQCMAYLSSYPGQKGWMSSVCPGWGKVQSRKCLPEIDLAHDLLFLADDIIK